MAHDVFISYSRQDQAFALKLKEDLEQQALEVWIDQSDLMPGQAWRAGIVAAIEACAAFLLILSPASVRSANVVKELAIAEENGKKIIPVLHQTCSLTPEMKYTLVDMQYQDFSRGLYTNNLAELMQVLQEPTAGEKAAPAPTHFGKFRKNGEIVGAQALELIKGTAPTGPPIWRDEFDTVALDTVWYWLNENSEMWTLRKHRGSLRIYSAPGKTGSQNLLLRPVYPGDFYIRTHLLFEPTTNYQFAGMVIYQDQNHFLQFGRAFCMVPDRDLGNGLYFDYIRDGGWVNGNFATATKSSNAAFLRLGHFGDKFLASNSEEGIDWSLVGIHKVDTDFNINAVGLTASQNYSGEAVPADFDFFELERVVDL